MDLKAAILLIFTTIFTSMPGTISGKEIFENSVHNETGPQDIESDVVSSISNVMEDLGLFHYKLPTVSVPLPPPDITHLLPSRLVAVRYHGNREPRITTPSPTEPSYMDKYLVEHFPGYFHSQEEIHEIDDVIQGRRQRRETDGDICCKTTLWFGPAPELLNDVNDGGPWKILQGDTVYQAFFPRRLS